jgi:hypothetical protein
LVRTFYDARIWQAKEDFDEQSDWPEASIWHCSDSDNAVRCVPGVMWPDAQDFEPDFAD